jgi:quinol monooxygenase YgiN
MRSHRRERALMPDLNVVAVLTAKEGQRERLQKALTSLIEPTRAEPGCVSYHLFESQLDENAFITVEVWRSPDDLAQHMVSPHIKAVLESAGDALDGAPAIHPLTPVGS